jgi:hypothetical protein
MLLFSVYVMKFEVCQEYTPQTLLHKHDIPQSSLHKHGTKTQITPYIPQAALHEHGTA